MSWFDNLGYSLINKISEHLFISSSALLLGIFIALPIAIIFANRKKIAQFIISICSILQTIPSLALLAIMVPLFGVGKVPAIIALFIYSLLPILRNAFLGMRGVDENLLDAVKGMGMTEQQIIFKVQLPLAYPVIMAGIRLAAVYVIGWTTIAAFIGAGGLGDLIFSGLTNFDIPLIIVGTISVTLIALCADLLIGKLEEKFAPRTSSKKVGDVHHV